jgi:2'-5' RNA ligase
MGRIAVDVVLLPDEAMTSRVIEINGQLIPDGPSRIVLNRKDCLPHISLAMGGLDEADVKAALDRLETVARQTTLGELRVVNLLRSTNSRGETTCLLEVERTEELQSLHERVMREMEPWFRYDVSTAMLYDDAVASSTLEWVRTYRQKAAYERFQPHITVGYGRLPADLSFPIPFSVIRLALCHLGNHGTCRRILAATKLA